MDGTRIKSLRVKRGYSLNVLSKKTGVSKSYLSSIEQNIHRNPSLDILKKIADALEIQIEDLIKEENYEILSQNPKKHPVTLKLEIDISDEQLDSNKIKLLQEFINEINSS